MKTPTTSPRNKQSELVLWALIVLFVTGGELLYRYLEPSLSGNIAHIQNLRSSFTELTNRTSSRVALIGNSLINEGVEGSILENQTSFEILKAVPDGTALPDWQCLIRTHVLSRHPLPVDHIVIGFAWNQLTDQFPPDPSRLGGYLCEFSAISHPEELGLTSFDQMAEFAAASLLRTYANRDTLRNRLLDQAIPDYRRFARQANRAARNSNRGEPDEVSVSYHRLEKIISELRERGIGLVLVAMPVRSQYDIPYLLETRLNNLSVPLLDYRRLSGITDDSFADEMHLNHSGRQVLSERLANDLPTLIQD